MLVPTAATDVRGRVWYNPFWVNQYSIKQLAAVWKHELWHLLNEHFVRRGERLPFKWNIAGDLAINPSLLEGGESLPADCIFPKMFKLPDGLLAEEYYNKLPSESDIKKILSQGSGGPGGKSQGSKSGGKGGEQGGGGKPGDDSSASKAPGCGGWCGGIAGNPSPFEEGEEPADAPAGLDEDAKDLIKQKTAQDIIQHARDRGTVPGMWKAWAEVQLKPPKVPWQNILRGRIRAHVHAYRRGQADYTYRYPHRRMAATQEIWKGLGPILPSMHSPLPRPVLRLDVSGSMLGAPLLVGLSEVMGCIKALGMPCDVQAVDAAVQAEAKITSVRDLKKINKGGGGTDMTIGLKEAEAKGYDMMFIITDGLTPWPRPEDMPRRMKLIPIIIGDPAGSGWDLPAHMGKAVKIPLDDLK